MSSETSLPKRERWNSKLLVIIMCVAFDFDSRIYSVLRYLFSEKGKTLRQNGELDFLKKKIDNDLKIWY